MQQLLELPFNGFLSPAVNLLIRNPPSGTTAWEIPSSCLSQEKPNKNIFPVSPPNLCSERESLSGQRTDLPLCYTSASARGCRLPSLGGCCAEEGRAWVPRGGTPRAANVTYQLGHLGFGASHFKDGGSGLARDIGAGNHPLQVEGDLVRFGTLEDLQGVFILDVVKVNSGTQELIPCKLQDG